MRVGRTASGLILGALVLATANPAPVLAQGAIDGAIARYQRLLQRNSTDPATYHRLGDAYVQKARESGDLTYFNLAEQALRKSLDLAPRNAGAWRHLAYVSYSRHEFEAAALQAAKAIALDPRDGDAYGILGDAHLEVGRDADAEQAYRTMMSLEEDLYSYGRLAGLKSLRGDAGGAIADLERAIEAGRAANRPRESVAWAEWQLASEHFALGELPRAEARYLAALRTLPTYYRALGGLAQLRAAERRYDEAIELYRRALAVIPLPEYAAALGDVYRKVGRAEEARKQYELVEYIGALNTVNQVIYNRELAYFYADHDVKLETALDLARKELEVRKDVYAYDVLAWTLYKNGDLAGARAAAAKALRLGTRDARLFFHAGMIHHRLGDRARAREYLGLALATNPRFHVFHVDTAEQTLVELGAGPVMPTSGAGGAR
jgi:tetratricopeptide (TPR) repeat protein